MADLIKARNCQKQLLSRFLCHRSRNTFCRARETTYFIFTGYTSVGGMDLDQSPKQCFPQVDPPLPASTNRARERTLPAPTPSNICLQLEATAKPCSQASLQQQELVGSVSDWRTNALIWIYKNLHQI